ncbi:acyl-CoA dehydrogenase C-terminal domain-containing protein [Acinetobacter bereziniae]|uniref:acyl-CoA dehydrogenase C-terminal domain-containing protein n=1 Tax=Acinetobacter bereziniae TaxID=106648 RepID=UPI001580CCE2|nr:acyl-CoA dehydrogenase C-terminal domain-containing protein [Acinetobacter bereziniae]NUF64407.1 acyl-CoA dehydrogenase C-terminal domain-containing protein [Acinetobacter bereziniae]NUG08777.1 acyl-CoA dehydrogenase C-terminal domain-containing protein [Acinetobacter bereziniae]NUG65294.1 acyl-CoA dehydrogenase C-terminal domain-containing protein [Acinetobacter bereziniae]NUG70901.1 acyl-CoA dehydrogenase C-terminal domain-containing protein [Acinetobacter bereziniae]NUG79835.1 acyl-CoA d
MPIYNAPLKDMQFILQDVFKAETFWQENENLAHLDMATANAILEEMAKFSKNVILDLNRSADEEGGAEFNQGEVKTPRGFKEAFQQFAQGGWIGLGANEAWGGQGMPKMLTVLADEMIWSCNPSFMLYPLLTVGAGMAIDQAASEEQKATYLPKFYTGEWSGTMCLTEPHAGTDLGIIKTKAVPNNDGSYNISGTKIFITSGEHDLSENIIHLVLAKTPHAPAGSRGISLFIVPKFLINQDGSLGKRNTVSAGSIEHKMGIKGSATCVMNFDAAQGYLVGKENEGLAAMFIMMNYERLSMGIQGIGASEFAYQNAAQYATDRLQGRSASGQQSPDKPADSILVHADVRRMLLNSRANNEASRAFAVYVGQQLDITKFSTDIDCITKANERVALLTPIAKAYLTDKALEAALEAQMCFGGHGYIREWGMEQCIRDLRISQIYEGTNGVQALDLIGRKTIKSNGAFIADYLTEIREFADSMQDEMSIKVVTLDVCAQVDEITKIIIEQSKVSPDFPSAVAVDYLHVVGLLSFTYMFARIAQAAQSKSDTFYQNKLVLAQYYVAKVLPDLATRIQRIQAGADLIMQLPEDYFTAQA